MSFESILLERVNQFSFDPFGTNGVRRENKNEPVATPQSFPNFIMPHLGADYVDVAIPNRDSMTTQQISQVIDERTIRVGMREKDLVGHGWREWLETKLSVAANCRRNLLNFNASTSRIVQVQPGKAANDPWDFVFGYL